MAVPLQRDADHLYVVVADPTTGGLREELERVTGETVVLVLAPPSEVPRVLDQSYQALAGVAEQVREFEITSSTGARTAAADREEVDENAPVVQVVNLILEQAVRDRASDVHIEPQDDRVRVRVRTDGALHDMSRSRRHGAVARQPHQGHGRHEHRRAAPPQDGQIERHGRLDASSTSACRTDGDGLRREVRAAAARQDTRALQAARARHGGGRPRRVLGADPLAVRHGDLRGPDRLGQDDDAVRHARRRSTTTNTTS